MCQYLQIWKATIIQAVIGIIPATKETKRVLEGTSKKRNPHTEVTTTEKATDIKMMMAKNHTERAMVVTETTIVPTTNGTADEKVVMTMTIMKDHTKEDMVQTTIITQRNIPEEVIRKRISRKISMRMIRLMTMKDFARNHILARATTKRVITKGKDSIEATEIPL